MHEWQVPHADLDEVRALAVETAASAMRTSLRRGHELRAAVAADELGGATLRACSVHGPADELRANPFSAG